MLCVSTGDLFSAAFQANAESWKIWQDTKYVIKQSMKPYHQHIHDIWINKYEFSLTNFVQILTDINILL